jgi:hypothetical protein
MEYISERRPFRCFLHSWAKTIIAKAIIKETR